MMDVMDAMEKYLKAVYESDAVYVGKGLGIWRQKRGGEGSIDNNSD